ncbi:MAG: alpha/beta hydrolase [Elusimicrobiales bacterium]|nr:alpha/beta hydrolase [Elusimicrobiales bacterium]
MKKNILLNFLLCFCTLFLTGCTHLFFAPTRYAYSNPVDEGYIDEAFTFESKDGTKLTGMFFPSRTAVTKGTVVHFHGNGQNMTSHYRSIAWIAAHGYNVVTFDYRGYGASGGRAGSVPGAVLDSVAALQTALDLPGVNVDKVIVYGQSLGTAMALAAVAESGFEPAAVILEGSFYSYKGEARAVLAKHWITWPFLWLPTVAISDKFAPKDEIKHIKAPKLFIHSVKDTLVPYSQGKKLYKAAPEPKLFWDVPAGHVEAFTFYGNYFSPRLLEYLDKVLKNKPGAEDSNVYLIDEPTRTMKLKSSLEEKDNNMPGTGMQNGTAGNTTVNNAGEAGVKQTGTDFEDIPDMSDRQTEETGVFR